jgi:GMP synthase-like glutamine amidotransferase
MKIGLLVCDHTEERFLGYPSLLQHLMPICNFQVYFACDNEFPTSAYVHDAWLITGSRCSVYEASKWISTLKLFVKEIQLANKYCVGICFGHQILAEALGGKVEKSELGWCLGVHTYQINFAEKWMEPFQPEMNVVMSCQDQVIVLPPNGIILASTSSCRVAIMKIGDRILGIQGHPEFSREISELLLNSHKNEIEYEKFVHAFNSLSMNIHNSILSKWICNFLLQVQ